MTHSSPPPAPTRADHPTPQPLPGPGVAALTAVLMLAALQRAPVAGLGALLPDLRLPEALTSVLTAAPALAICLAAVAVPALTSRWGLHRVLTGCAGILACALIGRAFGGPAGLLVCSIAAYLAIAVSGVLLPVYLRQVFGARRSGTWIAVCAGMISGGVGVAGALTPMLMSALGGDWQLVLALQALPALLVAMLWTRTRHSRGHDAAGQGEPEIPLAAAPGPRRGRFRRSPQAWLLGLFFGLQSMLAVALLSFEPLMLRAAGITPQAAGWHVALTMTVSVATMITVGAATNRARNQTMGLCVMTAAGGAGLAGLWLVPTAAVWTSWAAAGLLGVGVSVLGVALALPAQRAHGQADIVRLSSWTQCCGYALAACGPAALALVSPTTGLIGLLMATGLQFALALRVGRAGTIHPR